MTVYPTVFNSIIQWINQSSLKKDHSSNIYVFALTDYYIYQSDSTSIPIEQHFLITIA